jgi:cobaltochelatase CobN
MDSAASAINLLKEFQKQGYKSDYLPENGKKLMETVLNGLTNGPTLVKRDDELANRAVAKIPNVQYLQWFNELPANVKEKTGKSSGANRQAIFSTIR